MKTNNFLPISRIKTIFVFLLIPAFFLSCQKNSGISTSPTSDTAKFHAATSDTGFKPVGATMISSMLNGAINVTSFTASTPLVLSNEHDITINGLATSNISLLNCYNITIKNCKIGPNRHSGVNLEQCTNITIDSCYLYQVSTGVFAADSKTISVTNCQAKNMMGPFPEGQFVQFKNVNGGGNKVSFNKFENILGQSYTEDAISMYNSNGLPADPITIESNWIKGGGPSLSGGGIMLGDGGGSNMIAKNNFLVDPGQYGMAVSGGTFMCIINNTVYAKAQSFTNVGLYYRNYSGPSSTNIKIAKNVVNFINSKSVLSNTYLGPGDPAPIGWNTNVYRAGIDSTILPASIVSGLIFQSQ